MYKISDIRVNITSYNRDKYIIPAVNSLLRQSVGEFEINVFDNFSTDNTLKKLIKLDNRRIKLYRSTFNIGGHNNFKRVVNQSNKKFTIIFHDDDLIHHNYLEYILMALNENPKASLVCSGMLRANNPQEQLFKNYNFSYKKFKDKSNFISLVYLGFPMCFPSCLYKTENMKKVIKIKAEKFGKICDRPVVYSAVKEGEEIILFPGQYIHYRLHSGQDSNSKANGPFPNQIFELQKLYYNELYLNSNFKSKLIFLTSFYYYMSLDFKNFKSEYNSRKTFILEFVEFVNGKILFVYLSKFLYFLKIRNLYKVYRVIKRNIGQYS